MAQCIYRKKFNVIQLLNYLICESPKSVITLFTKRRHFDPILSQQKPVSNLSKIRFNVIFLFMPMCPFS
jgi:hypothetical protein